MLCQTLTSQILAYKWYPYGRNLSICQTFFHQILFNLAIRQTLARQTLLLYGIIILKKVHGDVTFYSEVNYYLVLHDRDHIHMPDTVKFKKFSQEGVLLAICISLLFKILIYDLRIYILHGHIKG